LIQSQKARITSNPVIISEALAPQSFQADLA